MKIAVSSQNFRTITGHAGKSRRFIIIEQNEQGELVETGRLDLPKEMSLHEFKGEVHPLFSFDVLITGSAGQGFIRRLTKQQVQVLCTSETDPVTAARAVVDGQPLPAAVEHHHHDHHSEAIMPTL
ncbi:MAG: nitrogen fixation protein [Candidatus Thiodiazotropha sp.]|jgi:predicted Fe-Mo cluster-binding NifX family protein